MTMKQNKEKFDFKAFGQAIKAARKAKGISRNQLADTLNIAPRYIASIENSGQHPSLQILYELVTLLDVSVDQFFFPEREQEKSTRRRQLDTMLDGMSEKDLKILSATAKGIEEANNDENGGNKSSLVFVYIEWLKRRRLRRFSFGKFVKFAVPGVVGSKG